MEKPIGKYLRARRPISAPLAIAIISPEYICVCVAFCKARTVRFNLILLFLRISYCLYKSDKVCNTYVRVSVFSRDKRWII